MKKLIALSIAFLSLVTFDANAVKPKKTATAATPCETEGCSIVGTGFAKQRVGGGNKSEKGSSNNAKSNTSQSGLNEQATRRSEASYYLQHREEGLEGHTKGETKVTEGRE